MKPYLLSLGAGLLVGIAYNLLGVRSPAPPIIALVGLAGILLGEQALPIARRLVERVELTCCAHSDGVKHLPGKPPANAERDA